MPEPPRGTAQLRHKPSARQQALGAAEHALLPASSPLIGDVIEVVIFRGFDEDVVARLDLVDELELERANAVPVLAGRDLLDVDLRPVLADLGRSEEHTSELQSLAYLVCRLLLETKK